MTLITSRDRTVPVTVQGRTPLAPDVAFTIIAPIELPTVFKPVWPFPGVAAVVNQTEKWDHAGPSRNPQFTDGSQATEKLTEYTPGHSFGYELTDFTNVLGRLASGVRGEWTFTPDASGTVIRWTYEFKPLPGRRPIVAGPFARLWARYMRAALTRAIAAAEAHGSLVRAAKDDRTERAASARPLH